MSRTPPRYELPGMAKGEKIRDAGGKVEIASMTSSGKRLNWGDDPGGRPRSLGAEVWAVVRD